MLSKPNAGWSDFQLDHTSAYGLSYLDDIAFERVSFVDYGEEADFQKKKELLVQKLARLKELILEREEWFGENRCFL